MSEYVSHCESLWKLTNLPAFSSSVRYLRPKFPCAPHDRKLRASGRAKTSSRHNVSGRKPHVRELPDVSHVLSADASAAVWPDILEAIHDDAPELPDRQFILLVLVFQQVVDEVACVGYRITTQPLRNQRRVRWEASGIHKHKRTGTVRGACSSGKELWVRFQTLSETLQHEIHHRFLS